MEGPTRECSDDGSQGNARPTLMRETPSPEGRRATCYLLLVSLATAAATGAAYLFTVGTPLGQLVGELILGGRALGWSASWTRRRCSRPSRGLHC